MVARGGDRSDADLAVALLGPVEIGSAGGVMTPVECQNSAIGAEQVFYGRFARVR
jgi:hypothetical protein